MDNLPWSFNNSSRIKQTEHNGLCEGRVNPAKVTGLWGQSSAGTGLLQKPAEHVINVELVLYIKTVKYEQSEML